MNKYLPFFLIATLAACGGGGGGGDEGTTPTSPVTDPTPDPEPAEPLVPDLEEGETSIRDALVIETSGGRYELTNASAGSVAGETAYRINVAANPSRNGVGGFGTALEFEGTNVNVFAGTDDGNQPNFGAIPEDTVNAPGANATFTGHYSVADENFAAGFDFVPADEENGSLTLNFDLAAGTVTGTSDNGVFSVTADVVSGGELEGSVAVNGDNADIVTGGFYGTSDTEVAGAFANDNFGGYFYGQ